MEADDRRANDRAVRDGERVLSAYATAAGRVWLITEWDRSATTLLLPEEHERRRHRSRRRRRSVTAG